jgi:hypothetical protein
MVTLGWQTYTKSRTLAWRLYRLLFCEWIEAQNTPGKRTLLAAVCSPSVAVVLPFGLAMAFSTL